jgi:hypothetical protein
MTMRGLAIGASAVVAAGVIAVAYLLGAHSSPPRPGNASTIEVPRSAAPPAGPLESQRCAIRWLLRRRGCVPTAGSRGRIGHRVAGWTGSAPM